MREQAKNVAYVAVGTAEATITKAKELVGGVARSARKAGTGAAKVVNQMEKRGQKVMSRTGATTRRAPQKSAAALRAGRVRAGSTASTTRSRSSSRPSSGTKTRRGTQTRARRNVRARSSRA